MKLTKPLAFYDLETTGLNTSTDKIVSITITKLMPDESIEKKYSIINPEMLIPQESVDLHGITNEMVKGKPTFKQLSQGIYEFMKDCDLVGYNNNYYDNSLLQEEFAKCDIDYPNKDVASVDCCFIFKHFQKRDLTAALKHYCNEEMMNAHDSEADADATMKIFLAQIEKHPELKDKTIKEISDFCNPNNRVDWQGKIVYDKDGDYIYNFGASKGQKVKDNPGFAKWVLKKDFPLTLKVLLMGILDELEVKIED